MKKAKAWACPFVVIGMNSITIYLARAFLDLRRLEKYFFGGAIARLPEAWTTVAMEAGYVLTCWLFLFFLYRKKVFLKI